MTTTQLPTAHDAVTMLLDAVREVMPETTQAQRYDFARRSVLASIVTDAETNAGRRVRYYADQLDRIDMLVARWNTAGDAAELCTIPDHYDRFPINREHLGDLQAIDNHVWAHMPHNQER